MVLPKSYGIAAGWNRGPGQIGTPFTTARIAQVATRAMIPDSTAAFAQIMSQTRHVCMDDVTSLQVEFPNFSCSSGTENDQTGDTQITASISKVGPTGPWTRITFQGANMGVLEARTRGKLSDPVAITMSRGTVFWIRNWRNHLSGTIIYGAFATAHTQDACAFGATTTDLTNSGSGLSGGGGSICSPSAIVGLTNRPALGLIGDSRCFGYNDTADTQGEIGEVCRSIGQYFAYLNTARAQMSARQWNTAAGLKGYRASLINDWCSHVYVELGINNFINDNQTLAQAQAANQTIYDYYNTRGKKVYGHTAKSQTTGAWTLADGSDQTVFRSAEAFNTWLLTVPTPLTAVFDPVSVFQLAGNRDKWFAPGYTTDGIHPSQAAMIALRNSGIIKPQLISF